MTAAEKMSKMMKLSQTDTLVDAFRSVLKRFDETDDADLGTILLHMTNELDGRGVDIDAIWREVLGYC